MSGIDFSSPVTFIKTMRLNHYEHTDDFFSDLHEQVDKLEARLKEAEELIKEVLVKYPSFRRNINSCRIDLIKIHNDDSTQANVQDIRASCLVIASQIGLELEAVNPWNLGPVIVKANSYFSKQESEG